MKTLVINGSPRGRRSNSQRMADAFLKGIKEAGGAGKTIFLWEYDIQHCRGCFSCWTKTPHVCVIQDDMPLLRRELYGVALLVLAFPLYVDSMPGQLKAFFDRCIAGMAPWFAQDEQGETRHRETGMACRFAVLCNCGYPEQSHFQAVDLLFARMARNFNTTVAAAVYRSQGSLLQSEQEGLQPLLNAYFADLQEAGRVVGSGQPIPAALQARLEQPLLAKEAYLAAAEASWRRHRSIDAGSDD